MKYFNDFDTATAYVLAHARNFWCRPDVLSSIEQGVGTFIAEFGEHVQWWNTTALDKAMRTAGPAADAVGRR